MCAFAFCSCSNQPPATEEVTTSDTLTVSEPSVTVPDETDEITTVASSEAPVTPEQTPEATTVGTPEPPESSASGTSQSSSASGSATTTSAPVTSETTTVTAPVTSSTTTQSGTPELTPLESEGVPLLINITPTSVSRIVYTYSQNTTSENYKNDFVTLKNPSLKKDMLSYLNGLVYIPLKSDKKTAETKSYEKWQAENPSSVLVPEAITLYNSSGKEIISFYSDAKAIAGHPEPPTPYVRARYNGVEYELFYGELSYDKLRNTVTNSVLLQQGLFTLQTYSSVAGSAISSYASELSSMSASSYRLYPPTAPIISTDGTVIYPSEFSSGTLLVDCVYSFTDGGTLTVTLNTDKAEILRIEAAY